MIFRNRLKTSKTMMRIGMASLLIFFMWPRFFPLATDLGPDFIDATRGVLLGLSIGLNLLAVRLNSRQQRCGDR